MTILCSGKVWGFWVGFMFFFWGGGGAGGSGGGGGLLQLF